jgi:hypothetical protein
MRQIERKQAGKTNLQSVKDNRAAYKCQACGTGYKRKSDLAGHVCTPIVANNDNDDGKKTEPFKKSNTILLSECNTRAPLMGHGLVTHRSQNHLSSAVKNIYWKVKGVANSGDRKGVLEMMESCFKKLPALAVPSILAVSSWWLID